MPLPSYSPVPGTPTQSPPTTTSNESLKALALPFWQLVAEAAALREAAVAAAVVKTRAELGQTEEEAAADARLMEVAMESEGLERRLAAFRRVLGVVERRLEELEEGAKAEVLALQSPPLPLPLTMAADSSSKRGAVAGSLAVRLLLVCLALGLTEPAVHLLFVVAREWPAWSGEERVVIM